MNRLESSFENTNVQKPGEQSAFEKIYQSKISRSLALVASLSFLGQFAYRESHREAHPDSEIEVAKKVIDIGDLSKKVNMYAPVEGSQYVVSIGQIHADLMQEVTANGFRENYVHGVQDLIDNQKNIEALVDRFADRDNVHTVYLENTPSAWGIDMIRETKGRIEQAATDHGKIAYIQELHEYSRSLKLDCERGPFLYLLSWELKNIAANNLSADDLNARNDMENILTNDPLIAGENVYMWGGAMKAFIEGKVDIHVADDEHAYDNNVKGPEPGVSDEEFLGERLRAAHVKAAQLLSQKEFVAEGAIGNNIREDAALAIIARDAAQHKQKFYPVIYGVAHEFTDNVQKYDKDNHADFGLINIYDKAN